MPSRKKAKGKARKAAKEAKAIEAAKEESRAVKVAADQRQVQDESVEAQIQRLIINAVSPTMCRHGFPSLSTGEEKMCLEFINAYIAEFHSEIDVGTAIFTAHHATSDEYADVYDTKLDTVISMLLSRGTQMILEGDKNTARMYAALAIFFEEFMEVYLRKTQAAVSCTKIAELVGTDDHTLVSYYRKRISCSCLDEKYKEVKSMKKMGLCHNPNCNLPLRKAERRKMFSCTRCGDANYCSVECQRADWKTHKKTCNRIVEQKAAFNSNQTSSC